MKLAGVGGVTGHDTRQVCPTDTTDYTLDAYPPSGGEPVEKVVTVNVQKPTKNGATPAIPAGNWVDLTLGTQDSTAASHWDFQWDTTHSLVPKNGATFAWVGMRGFTDVQQSECLNNTGYSAASLSGAQVGAGSVICFKTHDGHSGKMRISNSGDQLTFQWVTW